MSFNDNTPDEMTDDEARALVGTYFQVSRRHRIVKRLPEGVTGIEALVTACGRDDALKWATGMGEFHAGDHYLRVYGAEKDELYLTRDAFDAYRKAGGDTYSAQVLTPELRGSRPR